MSAGTTQCTDVEQNELPLPSGCAITGRIVIANDREELPRCAPCGALLLDDPAKRIGMQVDRKRCAHEIDECQPTCLLQPVERHPTARLEGAFMTVARVGFEAMRGHNDAISGRMLPQLQMEASDRCLSDLILLAQVPRYDEIRR